MNTDLSTSKKGQTGSTTLVGRATGHTADACVGLSRIMASILLLAASILAVFTATPLPVSASGSEATVGMPFGGRWAYSGLTTADCGPASNQTSHPSCHEIYFGDWSTDLYAASGTAVRLKVGSSAGLSFSWDTSASGSCGETRRVNVFVNGAKVGRVHYTHLTGAASTSTAPTNHMTIGTIANLSCNPGGAGKHIHIEFDNNVASTYACYNNHSTATHTAGIAISEGISIGMLGSANTGAQQACTSIPDDEVPPPPPDADGDGTPDSADFCLQLPGNNINGCPWVDMDMDANGDGKDDLIHMWQGGVNTLLSTGDGTYSLAAEGHKPYAAYNMMGGRWYPGNFNGDQKTDLIHIHSGGVNTWMSNGDGTYAVTEGAKPVANYQMDDGFQWHVADVNGDGKDEILHLWPGGINTWMSNGNGTYSMPPTYIPRSNYNMVDGDWYPADANGDGKQDYYHIHSGGVNTLLAIGDGTYTLAAEGYKPVANYNMTGGFYWKVADVTGDGKDDILYFWHGGVDTWASNGNGTFPFTTYIPRANYGMTSGSWYFGDVNNDNKTDLLHQWSSGINTWLSNGNGTYALAAEGAKPVANYNMTEGFKFQVNDINGDGKAELLHLWHGGINTWIPNGSGAYTMPPTYIPRSGYGMTGGTWY